VLVIEWPSFRGWRGRTGTEPPLPYQRRRQSGRRPRRERRALAPRHTSS